MIHVPSGMEQLVRFHHVTQNSIQFKTYELVISEISIYYFWTVVYHWELTLLGKAKSRIRRGLLYILWLLLNCMAELSWDRDHTLLHSSCLTLLLCALRIPAMLQLNLDSVQGLGVNILQHFTSFITSVYSSCPKKKSGLQIYL